MTKVIAFDTETRGLDWFRPECRAFLATWADEDGEYVADLSDEEQRALFLNALDEADTLVAHNFSFDAHHVREVTGVDLTTNGWELHDTDLMSRVLFPEGQRKGERGGHGLKNLATVWLRADAAHGEEEIEKLAEQIGTKLKGGDGAYYDVWRAFPDAMEYYAKLDARYTYDLYERFRTEWTEESRRCYELEQRVLPILVNAERVGVALDREAVRALHHQYQEVQRSLRSALSEQLGEAALGGRGSEDALLDALGSLGVPLHRRTDSGKLSTNQFALQEFEDDFPVLAQLSEFRQANKFLSTYIEPMLDRETVHPSFRQCGAWTGRMSCTRPNMQNIPKRAGKEVRSMFVPREGHAFVVCDYESIEVRLLAWYLGDDGFRQLIADGHDPHAWMAANIHGGSPDDYRKGTDGQPLRDVAKNTLFAITYGAGAPRVADMNKISKEQAKTLIRNIKGSLPGFHRLNKRIRSKIEASGHVTTLFGRKQPVRPDKSYVGLNALIQGSAADIMKQGLVNVAEAVAPLGGIPLLVVHDEVVVEVPTERAQEALALTEAALVGAHDLNPPLAVTGSVVTTSYADA
jgi:DNA polymerase-1